MSRTASETANHCRGNHIEAGVPALNTGTQYGTHKCLLNLTKDLRLHARCVLNETCEPIKIKLTGRLADAAHKKGPAVEQARAGFADRIEVSAQDLRRVSPETRDIPQVEVCMP